MKFLLVGSGAREHAMARGLAADSFVSELHITPGNPGMATCGTVHDVPAGDVDALVALAGTLSADIVVVGPEAPLVDGLADKLASAGIRCCGPTAAAAQLEGSKAFAKDVMTAAGVPTAEATQCSTLDEVRAACDKFGAPHVVKADGLAGGKGVIVTENLDEAIAFTEPLLAKDGASVLVEEYLDGPEFSVFCLSDGEHVIALEPAQDYKRVHDGGLGPNTGGMGAYSPLPWAEDDLAAEVSARVAQPVIEEMAKRGTPFVGVLYCGLALTSKGIKVIEFNVRFGDPDANVVLARLTSPLGELLYSCTTGDLDHQHPITFDDRAAVTVVLASEGYPSTPVTGRTITGDLTDTPTSYILHAGTKQTDDGLLASGGRVLGATALGDSVEEARAAAYSRLRTISLEGGHSRSDIAHLTA